MPLTIHLLLLQAKGATKRGLIPQLLRLLPPSKASLVDVTHGPSGRPQHNKVSRIDKLAKESEIIGRDLMRVMEKTQGHKRKPSATVDSGLFNIPDNAPLNSMAPAAKKQRISLPHKKQTLTPLNENTTSLMSANLFAKVAPKTTLFPPPPPSQAHAPSNVSQQPSKTPSVHSQAVCSIAINQFGQHNKQLDPIPEDDHDIVMREYRSIGEAICKSQVQFASNQEDEDEEDHADMQPQDSRLRHIVWSLTGSDNEDNMVSDDELEGAQRDNWEEGSMNNDESETDEYDDENHEHNDDGGNGVGDDYYDSDEDNNNKDLENNNNNNKDHEDNIGEGMSWTSNHHLKQKKKHTKLYKCPFLIIKSMFSMIIALETVVTILLQKNTLQKLHANKGPWAVLSEILKMTYSVNEDDNNEGDQSEDSSDVNPGDSACKRAPRNSRHTGVRLPTTLAYYHGPWKMVLASSKVHWRCLLVIGNAWPSHQHDLHYVKTILNERLLHFKNEGVVFDDEFQINRDMWILVPQIFQECSTFRGKLKDYVRPILPMFYKEVILDEYEGNQLVVYDAVIDRVKLILDNGSFHHSPEKDRLGKTNNFAHPCIGHVIQQFFYAKADGIARSFPDDFSGEVPLNVIALVATAIVACLEEYLATGKQRNLPFDFKGYNGTYNNLVTSIDKVHADEYHGQKLLQLRRKWAAAGMALLKPVEEPNGRIIPVDLD
ncbi:hypothetical protein BJ165DRAFT_1406923 [Panaeolus papilionaceus]|nr:hypothetical protein BJ165DRAFT_1406923 [Panaeolus papilionaceus]